MPKRYALHAACKLFPKLSDDELEELAADIKRHGLRQPIVLHEGKILDGRNRLAACKIADVEPRFEKWSGRGSPVEWVISTNLVRRHLTASQRAVIALDLLPMLEKDAKDRQRLSRGRGKKGAQNGATSSVNGKASEIAASITRSSSRYIETVKAISKEAPELVERIRSGELSVPEARKVASASSNNGRKSHVRINSDDASRILYGDCVQLIRTLDDGSIQLALTSPPYAEQRNGQYRGVPAQDYPGWTVRWMERLWDKLADNGSVLVVIRPHLQGGVLADYVLRTRLALRDDGWFENEELIWLKPDGPPLGSTKRPRRTWESILWFSKSAQPFCNLFACGRESDRIGFAASMRFVLEAGKHIGQDFEIKSGRARCTDVFIAPVGTTPKRNEHPAVFPEMLAEQLILTFSHPDDLILDPFVGSGTVCAAAKRLGRDFRGFDTNKKYVRMTLRRLAEIECGR